MKVLYINMGDPFIAGSERSMLELIAAGGDRLRAHVLCNSGALARATRQIGHEATRADLIELSPYATPSWPVGGYAAGLRHTTSCVRKFRPDLIHANNIWPTQLAVPAGRIARIPVVGHIRATTLRSGQELSLMRLADHVIAVSETVAGPFRAMRWRKGPISIVFDPVDVDIPPRRPGPTPGPIRLGIAGRLSQEKAVHRTIDLLRWLRQRGLEATLTIFGDGPEHGDLVARVRRAGLESAVVFAGFCDNMPARLAEMDALLLSSLREALPRVIIEAGMVAVPTIAVPVGGIAEVIDDGVSGLLPGDMESPQNRRKILALLGDRDRLAGMGRRFHDFVREQFTPERSFQATESVYRQVLRGRQ